MTLTRRPHEASFGSWISRRLAFRDLEDPQTFVGLDVMKLYWNFESEGKGKRVDVLMNTIPGTATEIIYEQRYYSGYSIHVHRAPPTVLSTHILLFVFKFFFVFCYFLV